MSTFHGHRNQARDIRRRAEESRLRAHNIRHAAGCAKCGASHKLIPLCPDCYVCTKCRPDHSECGSN